MELTADEKFAAEGDCTWCRYGVYTEDGTFKECQNLNNPTTRPLLECPIQEPEYGA